MLEAVVAADVDGYAFEGKLSVVVTGSIAVKAVALLCFGGEGSGLRIC